ncbi:MAG: hypothetical protein HYY18_09170, partial [Planctomycetes bacterium]|nr:hypothetical protein [Planctomycetota bacterium]
MEQQQLSTQRGISLKLKVTFLAFLAVLPALILVAALNIMEGDTRSREREWQATRTNTASAVAAWFDSTYKDVLLSHPPKDIAPAPPPDPVTPEAIRRSLETGFDRTAR